MNNTIKNAFLKSVPVFAGFLVLGIGYGISLNNAGYGAFWAFITSTLIYAGSLQYVGISLISGGASILTTAMTSFMINARHIFYSISMIDRYKKAGKYKPYLIFALSDETYSILSSDTTPENVDENAFRFWVSFFNHSYWVLGSVLGGLIGNILPFSTAGIEFSMTALFIASFTEQWLSTKQHIPAITGLVCTSICLLIFGKGQFLIPSMLSITVVLTILKGKRGLGQ